MFRESLFVGPICWKPGSLKKFWLLGISGFLRDKLGLLLFVGPKKRARSVLLGYYYKEEGDN